MGKVIYIAGPMTGYQKFNHAAFMEAESKLKADGYTVINPADNFCQNVDLDHSQYMRMSIHQLLCADEVYMLHGWKYSRGATCEKMIAASLKLKISYQ